MPSSAEFEDEHLASASKGSPTRWRLSSRPGDALIHSTGGLTVLESVCCAAARPCRTGWGRGPIGPITTRLRGTGSPRSRRPSLELEGALARALASRGAPNLSFAALLCRLAQCSRSSRSDAKGPPLRDCFAIGHSGRARARPRTCLWSPAPFRISLRSTRSDGVAAVTFDRAARTRRERRPSSTSSRRRGRRRPFPRRRAGRAVPALAAEIVAAGPTRSAIHGLPAPGSSCTALAAGARRRPRSRRGQLIGEATGRTPSLYKAALRHLRRATRHDRLAPRLDAVPLVEAGLGLVEDRDRRVDLSPGDDGARGRRRRAAARCRPLQLARLLAQAHGAGAAPRRSTRWPPSAPAVSRASWSIEAASAHDKLCLRAPAELRGSALTRDGGAGTVARAALDMDDRDVGDEPAHGVGDLADGHALRADEVVDAVVRRRRHKASDDAAREVLDVDEAAGAAAHRRRSADRTAGERACDEGRKNGGRPGARPVRDPEAEDRRLDAVQLALARGRTSRRRASSRS